MFFFFKQKTAYEMRISDWSSDVCSSDLFVFLDAYDFDHGKHSELRQSRYKKFLGSEIDEIACHEMHLDCAKSVNMKTAAGGLVCLDDPWIADGKWFAKGTLAVPYLLDPGFEKIGRGCGRDRGCQLV